MTGASNVPVSADLTGLTEETTYHYRVVASNYKGTTTGSDQSFTTLAVYPTSITASTSNTFPNYANASDYTSTDYRLIGLPGNPNLDIASLLSGNQDENWQVYWDNGATGEDYLIEYDGGTRFKMVTGRAFWVIAQGNLAIYETVSTPSLNNEYEIEVPLHSGWNTITNPFNHTVAWSVVQSTNNISDPIWQFTGAFSQSTNFEPYAGYYFYNTANLSVLKIPYVGSSARMTDVNLVDWELELHLIDNSDCLATAVIGVDKEACDGPDAFDHRCPRGVGYLPALYMEHSAWQVDYPVFSSDIRSEIGELQVWDFTAQTSNAEECYLTIDGVESIPGIARLLDITHCQEVDVQAGNKIKVNPVGGVCKYRLLIGSPAVVEEAAGEVVPENFVLGQAFPNPFNPTTTLPLDIPEATHVNVLVYNTLGEQVTQLHSGELSAGRHYLVWQGRNDYSQALPSGVYFVQAIADDKISRQKIVLIK